MVTELSRLQLRHRILKTVIKAIFDIGTVLKGPCLLKIVTQVKDNGTNY